MVFYGIAISPFNELVQDQKVSQKRNADEDNVASSLEDLKVVHDKPKKHGSTFGYTLTKCNIITIESQPSRKTVRQQRNEDSRWKPRPWLGNRIRISEQ